jgi:glycosyltransferase involved in cell wall biosynthesis
MPRVLVLCEYPTLNGGEQSLLAVLPALAARGFRFRALAPDQGPLAVALAELAIEIEPSKFSDGRGQRPPQAEIRAQIVRAVERVRPDLVHANSLAMGRLAGPVMADMRRPSIAHLRDIVGLSEQAVRDLNQNSRLLAVSGAVRDFHVRQGVAADRTFVVHNGVDLACFQPRPATGWLHRELGLAPDAVLIGAIGQLVMRKGHDVLVEAAARLVEQCPQFHYVVAGDRYSLKVEAQQHEAMLRERTSCGSLAGHVHFVGYRRDIPELLAELTLLVHPARQEPLGRVLLEAAAAGVPIVATEVGGTREILSPDSAELVPADDSAALAGAIEHLMADKSLRRRRAAAALARIGESFTVEHAAAALERHYHQIIDGDTDAVRSQP